MIDEDTFYYSVAELSARLNKSIEFTLEEAVHERDFWESIDWKLDLLDLY